MSEKLKTERPKAIDRNVEPKSSAESKTGRSNVGVKTEPKSVRPETEQQLTPPNKRYGKPPGRRPKADPCRHRYAFNLNDEDNARFLAMYDASGLTCKARFIVSCIFGRPLRVVRIDKAAMDYYIRLTEIHSRYRAVGVNYNQIVRALKTNFGEKRGLQMLYRLEKKTVELVVLTRQVVQLTEEFERKYLDKQ